MDRVVVDHSIMKGVHMIRLLDFIDSKYVVAVFMGFISVCKRANTLQGEL